MDFFIKVQNPDGSTSRRELGKVGDNNGTFHVPEEELERW